MDSKTHPKNIKIFKPEPDKPSHTFQSATLLLALVFIVGIVFFIGVRMVRVGPETKQPYAPTSAREESSVSMQQEGSSAEIVMQAGELPDSRAYSFNQEGIDYLKRGDYQKARESFESALREAPSDTAIKQNLAATLSHIAWQEMSKTSYAASIQLFQSALSYNPLLPDAEKGIGIALLKLNETQKAAPYIDAYIENNPSDSQNGELLFLLSDAFLKSGDRANAAVYLERLLNRDPNNREVREKLALIQRENAAEKGFQKKEGNHFTVKFEGGENSDIGHLISIVLEEAYIKVGSDIGYYPEERIEAVLYTKNQFTDVTRVPNWVGALYDGRIKIPVGGITNRTTLLEKVLFHEYTHALVHRLSNGKAPLWLNEGIAQHEEGTVNEGINQILSFVAKAGKPMPLRAFEGSFMGFNDVQAMVAYSVSRSATEYIMNEYGVSAVKRILEKLGEGKSMDEAISSSLYISYDDLQSNWSMAVKKKYAE